MIEQKSPHLRLLLRFLPLCWLPFSVGPLHAADRPNLSLYRRPKGMIDMTLFQRQQPMIDHYKAQYAEPDPDADLVF